MTRASAHRSSVCQAVRHGRGLLAAAMAMLATGLTTSPSLALQPASATKQPTPAPISMADWIARYSEDESSVDRFYYIAWSDQRLQRRETFLDAELKRLDTVYFQSLDRDGKIDWILLHAHIIHEQAMLALAKRRLASMDAALPFRAAITTLEEARWRMEPVAPQQAADLVNGIPDMIKKARERIEKGRKKEDGKPLPEDAIALTPTIAKRAASATDSIARALDTWYRHRAGYEPDFSWWLKKPYEDAQKALDDYENYLRREVAGLKGEPDDPLVGDPIGSEALAADMAREFMAYSPEELVKVAEREFAWCEVEMKKAATEMGYDDAKGGWKAAIAAVKEMHAPVGGQDDMMSKLAKDGIDFVKKHDLVTIPPLNEELWRIRMAGPEEQRFLPFASYGGQVINTAYPTDAMKHADKLMAMRGNNEHFTRIVAPHELIPGHHLQGWMAQRYKPYRQLFSTPFFVEGWALYWEMLLWDMNYARNAEDKIGMLFWRMHRCARIIVSLKYELQQMEPAAMIDFLVDRVGHERANATGEVRRYIGGDYSPLYQVGYMIGGLQVRSLAHDVVDSGKMTRKQFNDAILLQGSIPIELIRASITDIPLTRDFKPQWRWDDVNNK